DASEAVVRRAAVRLELVYHAYARFLTPRCAGRRPTEIVLFRSRAEYADRLRAEKREFVNTAYYDPAGNRVVCASDLEQLGDDLDRARHQYQQIRADLDQRESALAKLYKGKEL